MVDTPLIRLGSAIPPAGMPTISLYDAAPMYPHADIAALTSAPTGHAQFDFGTRTLVTAADSLQSVSSLHALTPRPNAAAGQAGALTYGDGYVRTAPKGVTAGGIDTGFADDVTATYYLVYQHDAEDVNIGAQIIGTADQTSRDANTGWYFHRNPYSASNTAMVFQNGGQTNGAFALAKPAGLKAGDWLCACIAMDAAGAEALLSGAASGTTPTRGVQATRNLGLGNAYWDAGSNWDSPISIAEFIKVPGVRLTRAQMLADYADIKARLALRGIAVK